MKKSEKETKTKKIEQETVNDTVVLENRTKRSVKFVVLLSSFFATAMALLVFVFSVIAIVSVINQSQTELLNNNIVITMVSKMNNYSISEVTELINNMTGKVTFILFEIVIPTIAFVGAMILILVLAKRVIEFIDDVVYEKDLYNKKKLIGIQDIISILSIILLTTLVIFDKPSIFIFLLIEALLGIIYMLFKKCIILKRK